MAEFKYNDKLYTYHSMGMDSDRAIISLGKPRGEKTAQYNYMAYFSAPDNKGFKFKTMWMEYEKDEIAYDRAQETKIMADLCGADKSHFVIFDKEGAETLIEINKNWPELIDRVFADAEDANDIKPVFEKNSDPVNCEYIYGATPEEVFSNLKSTILGKKKDCPFCGHPMQMGYVYAPQTIEACWTPHAENIGEHDSFEKKDILPLRDDFKGYEKMREFLLGKDIENVSEGYLCRRCGKMIIDMAPVLIYYKDKMYLEANGLPDGYSEIPEDEQEKFLGGLTSVGNSVRNMIGGFGKHLQPKNDPGAPKKPEKEYHGERDDDEPKRRSIFGRGPKVE